MRSRVLLARQRKRSDGHDLLQVVRQRSQSVQCATLKCLILYLRKQSDQSACDRVSAQQRSVWRLEGEGLYSSSIASILRQYGSFPVEFFCHRSGAPTGLCTKLLTDKCVLHGNISLLQTLAATLESDALN